MSYLRQFHFQISGSKGGPKIVFLHGLMGSGANWRKITPAFHQSHEILTYDQRGHGRSFHPDKGYESDDFAEDLHQILNELGWTKPVFLVGHSLGGRNALAFTHRYPERIRKLVLEDIGPQANLYTTQKIEGYLESIPTPFQSKQEAKIFFEEKFPLILGGDSASFILSQFFYSNIELNAQGLADWRFSRSGILASIQSTRGEAQEKKRWDQITQLKIPTLLIRGSESRDFTSDSFQQVLKSNSLIQGVEIGGAGHWVHFDQPEAFIRVLKEFLG